MAIFHLSVKTVSRSAGRSATAAAAYRAGVEITDRQTGEVHDYRRKGGVESAELFLPAGAPEWASDRNELWNAVEKSETRKNSTVAREFEVALPSELSADQRKELAHDFTNTLVKKYGFAADCAIHAPGKEGDSKNHHAHILCSTRKLTAEGFTAKTRELDDRATGAAQVVECRELFADMTNAALEKAGHSARVDHRSLVAQGIDRDAGIHLGPAATAIERRGEVSQKTERHQERQQEAAGKVAAMVAIAEAQAKAAEQAAQAQAQREAVAASQARAAAEQAAARLTAAAEAKEKDDGIRKAALAALARSSAATDRACAFAVADHAGIADNLRAASSDLGRAVKGAQRRVSARHYGRVVEAVRGQFERVGRVVQQVADRIERVVRSVTAAAHEVAQQQARLELARQRAAARPVDTRSAKEIWAASPENPLNIAKREAQQAASVATKRTPVVKIEQKTTERAKPVPQPSPPKPTEQEAQAKLLQAAIAKQAQWDAALVAERALHQKELTQQAYDKTVAHVAEHQAHIDAKPRLFGRDKWEAQRQIFENRDTANNHEWKTLKEGHYPFLERDKEAVQKAVERRVSDKNPALARDMPEVNAALQAERERVDALEKVKREQEQGEKRKTWELDKALSDFKTCALKREMKANSYGDTGQQWNAIPESMRGVIEDFNRLPKEARPVVLERMRENMKRDPQGAENLMKQLENGLDTGMSR